MQLRPLSSAGSHGSDIATVVAETAATLGHLPVITQYTPHGRAEQSAASIAQWVAKGAHFFELDTMLEVGDSIYLDARISWTSAAVALSAWWAGIRITFDPAEAEVAIIGQDRSVPTAVADVFRIGDAIDGTPTDATAPAGAEAWTKAVQTFPDQPPAPHASSELVAIGAATQAELIEQVRRLEPGRLGLVASTADASDEVRRNELAAAALRPFVTGEPSVVVAQLSRDAADPEKVATWL